MTIDRWEELVEQIRSTFDVEDVGSDASDEHGGTDIQFIIFNGPAGRLKLEFITQPVLTDTRTKYSNRIGSDVTIEQTYSETEKAHRLEAWRWDEAAGTWNRFDSGSFEK